MEGTHDTTRLNRVAVHDGLFELGPGDTLRLRVGSCLRCEKLFFPLADSCPYCGAEDVAPILLEEVAEVEWSTVVAKPPPGFEGPVPYGLGVVRFASGLTLVAPLLTATPLPRATRVRSVAWEVGHDPTGHSVVTFAFRPLAGIETDSSSSVPTES